MAPCFETSAASIRQASMTMSWVAETKATKAAKAAITARFRAGSVPDISQRPIISNTCSTIIQLRRCPSRRVRPGTWVRSISGAHRNFSE